MNGRRLYREYTKSKRYDCKEFIELKDEDYYGVQEIKYKDSQGNLKTSTIDPVKRVYWIIKSFDNNIWEHYKIKN